MPIESVIPTLRGIVEQALIAATCCGNYIGHRLAIKLGAVNCGVHFVDIGLMVLGMMKAQRMRRDSWFKRGVSVWKGG